jgi:hypothetical protein
MVASLLLLLVFDADPKVPLPWSLAPLAAPPLPDMAQTHPVDQFVIRELKARGLELSKEADRITLLRRAHLDLTGILPTLPEREAFLADTAPGSWERLIDRLMASPGYGERWGRHWLDVARFAESQGYERDKPREAAWPYRDWVISAFQSDMSYGDFVKRQVAGDLISPSQGGDVAATGFLVAGPYDEAGNGANNAIVRLKAREDELEDMVGTTAQAFLGLTVHCARCHDHKFDPITLADYHRLKAALAGARHGVRPRETPDLLAQREKSAKERETRRASLLAERSKIENAAFERAKIGMGLPLPRMRWHFARGLRDEVTGIELVLKAGATASLSGLKVSGSGALAETGPVPLALAEKTLEVWTLPANLDQRGGSVLTVESLDGGSFDAIVLGELEPRAWMPGSDGFQRTRPQLELGAKVESSVLDQVHLAIAYSADGTIAMYRNGVPYGKSYRPGNNGLVRRESGAWRVMVGLRHHGSTGYYNGTVLEARIYDRALLPQEVNASWHGGPDGLPFLGQIFSADELKRRGAVQESLVRLEMEKDPPANLVYAAVQGDPGVQKVLHRGDVDKPRADAVPASLSCIPGGFSLPVDAPDSVRRMALANWLSSVDNPVVWRVMSNRVWQWHFGSGLAMTPSDVGNAGEKPENPELLDHLAVRFRDGGGRLKDLHRHIMSSRTYKQSSAAVTRGLEIDARARLLWRRQPGRMDAEDVRDNLLHVAGLLERKAGGPSYQPFIISTFNSTFYNERAEDVPELWRRSVYRMQVRSARSNLLDAFDCPDPSVRTAARAVTTTPAQALALMNGVLARRCAAGLASRADALGMGMEAKLRHLWLLALCREPDAETLQKARALAESDGLPAVAWSVINSAAFTRID